MISILTKKCDPEDARGVLSSCLKLCYILQMVLKLLQMEFWTNRCCWERLWINSYYTAPTWTRAELQRKADLTKQLKRAPKKSMIFHQITRTWHDKLTEMMLDQNLVIKVGKNNFFWTTGASLDASTSTGGVHYSALLWHLTLYSELLTDPLSKYYLFKSVVALRLRLSVGPDPFASL